MDTVIYYKIPKVTLQKKNSEQYVTYSYLTLNITQMYVLLDVLTSHVILSPYKGSVNLVIEEDQSDEWD